MMSPMPLRVETCSLPDLGHRPLQQTSCDKSVAAAARDATKLGCLLCCWKAAQD